MACRHDYLFCYPEIVQLHYSVSIAVGGAGSHRVTPPALAAAAPAAGRGCGCSHCSIPAALPAALGLAAGH
jgi:hypothetical protein